MSDASFQQRAQHLAAANSFLFVGGDSEHRLRKALESRAHVVIADLEDAVHPHRKQVARETLARVLGRQSRRRGLVAVRINQAGTPESGPDQDLIAELAVDGLVLPKASPTMMPLRLSHPLIPIVRDGLGLRLAYEVARLAEVVRLMLGTVDLGVELGLSHYPNRTSCFTLVRGSSSTAPPPASRRRSTACGSTSAIRPGCALRQLDRRRWASAPKPASIRPRSPPSTRCSPRRAGRSPGPGGSTTASERPTSRDAGWCW